MLVEVAGCEALAQMLHCNNSLETLTLDRQQQRVSDHRHLDLMSACLRSNPMGDYCVGALAGALPCNHALRRLSLHNMRSCPWTLL